MPNQDQDADVRTAADDRRDDPAGRLAVPEQRSPSAARLLGMTARGTEARVLPDRQFEVTDLNLTFFSGDAAAKVETVILSPKAIFLPDDKLAHGEHSVRFIRDEVEASGTRWVYDHAHKKISLDGAVHVTFHAEFQDLLK